MFLKGEVIEVIFTAAGVQCSVTANDILMLEINRISNSLYKKVNENVTIIVSI